MTGGAARALIRLAAWIAPKTVRARWREEWLAEVDAMTTSSLAAARLLMRAAGAPWDALHARLTVLNESRRTLAHGWCTDLRQTIRSLVHNARHAITVVLCLATGIIVTVSVFSAVNALFHGDVPGVRDRASLVRIFSEYQGEPGAPRHLEDDLSVADFDALAAAPVPALAGLIAEGEVRLAASAGDVPFVAAAAFTSADYFAVLGTQPAAGRLLTAADDRADAPPVAAISYQLWRDRFATSPDVVGRRIVIGDRDFVLVGVAPEAFAGASTADRDTEIFLPLRQARGWSVAPNPERAWLTVLGRLRPSATRDDVQRSLTVAAARRVFQRPDLTGMAYIPKPHGPAPTADTAELLVGLMMMLAIPVTVLAVACLNVANLQLARATTRSRELGVRLAMGASRGQIIRLLTLETGILACLAAAAGWVGTALVIQLAQSSFPLIVSLDIRVLSFVLILTLGVTMVSGVLPAWVATRRSAALGLRHTAQGGGLPHARLRHALVVLQIATSFLLLVGSSLFVRMTQSARDDMPPALDEQIVLSFDLRMMGRDAADAARVQRELEARLTVRSDVRAVSFERGISTAFGESAAASPQNLRPLTLRDVTPAYAAVSDLQLLAGRWLQSGDAPHAVVVNDRLARELSSDGPVLGRQIFIPGRLICDSSPCDRGAPAAIQIVGIVADQKNSAFESQPNPTVYRLLDAAGATGFVMRVRSASPNALAADVRAVVHSVDPRLPWARFSFGPDLYAGDDEFVRLIALGAGGLGVLALLLAAAGLYAVMAYVVSLRQREFGIRMAIGARSADLTTIVAKLSVQLTAVGLIGGVVIVVPLALAARALIVGVSLRLLDPWSWLPVIAMLAVVAVVAAIVPARRAARVDPVAVLRAD